MSPEPGDTTVGTATTGPRPDPAETTRRRLDRQAEQLRGFAARLETQIREATEAHQDDRVREAMTRLRAVRARLEEIAVRRGAVRSREGA